MRTPTLPSRLACLHCNSVCLSGWPAVKRSNANRSFVSPFPVSEGETGFTLVDGLPFDTSTQATQAPIELNRGGNDSGPRKPPYMREECPLLNIYIYIYFRIDPMQIQAYAVARCTPGMGDTADTG